MFRQQPTVCLQASRLRSRIYRKPPKHLSSCYEHELAVNVSFSGLRTSVRLGAVCAEFGGVGRERSQGRWRSSQGVCTHAHELAFQVLFCTVQRLRFSQMFYFCFQSSENALLNCQMISRWLLGFCWLVDCYCLQPLSQYTHIRFQGRDTCLASDEPPFQFHPVGCGSLMLFCLLFFFLFCK